PRRVDKPWIDPTVPRRLEHARRIAPLPSAPPGRAPPGRLRAAAAVLLVLATLGSVLAVTLGLHLEPNVASLLPDRGEAAALRRYVRGFGGADLAIVMVKG